MIIKYNMAKTIEQLKKDVLDMKLKALDISLSAGQYGELSHVGSAFSAMEIMSALYEVAKIDDPEQEDRDRVIISKAHCILALYTALYKKGLISESELETVDKNGTTLWGHPYRNLKRGIEFSGGSLGLGISYAAGVAYSCKLKGLNNRIFVLLGDGECNEGIVWEALMSIAHFKLSNLTVIVDKNGLQFDGTTDEIMSLGNLEDKFKAFGYDVVTVNGHEVGDVVDALRNKSFERPNVVIAKTNKANGISFLENQAKSHVFMIKQKEYDLAKNDIISAYEQK